MMKNPPASTGEPGLFPGSRRSPGIGNGNPLQYSCLENSMDRGAWRTTVHKVTKNWTQLSAQHTHTHTHKTSPSTCKSQFLVLDSWIPLSVCLSIHLSDQHLSPIYLSYSFCLWFNPGWCSYKILKVKNYA